MKQVVSERCPLCGGRKQPGKTTYSVDLGSRVILVPNVPATVCLQCGEAWIEHHTAQKLEQIIQEAREKGLQVEIMAFGGTHAVGSFAVQSKSPVMVYVYAVVLTLINLLCWIGILFGLPGMWLMILFPVLLKWWQKD